jgi:hypothetical protein
MNTLIIAALILLWLTAGFYIGKVAIKKETKHQEVLDGDDLAMWVFITILGWPVVGILLLFDKLAKKFNIKIK